MSEGYVLQCLILPLGAHERPLLPLQRVSLPLPASFFNSRMRLCSQLIRRMRPCLLLNQHVCVPFATAVFDGVLLHAVGTVTAATSCVACLQASCKTIMYMLALPLLL